MVVFQFSSEQNVSLGVCGLPWSHNSQGIMDLENQVEEFLNKALQVPPPTHDRFFSWGK